MFHTLAQQANSAKVCRDFIMPQPNPSDSVSAQLKVSRKPHRAAWPLRQGSQADQSSVALYRQPKCSSLDQVCRSIDRYAGMTKRLEHPALLHLVARQGGLPASPMNPQQGLHRAVPSLMKVKFIFCLKRGQSIGNRMPDLRNVHFKRSIGIMTAWTIMIPNPSHQFLITRPVRCFGPRQRSMECPVGKMNHGKSAASTNKLVESFPGLSTPSRAFPITIVHDKQIDPVQMGSIREPGLGRFITSTRHLGSNSIACIRARVVSFQ